MREPMLSPNQTWESLLVAQRVVEGEVSYFFFSSSSVARISLTIT